MSELRRVVAGSLAAAVLIGAGAGAASAAVFEGGLEFLPSNWQEGAADAFGGGLTYPDTWEDTTLQGPPERQEEAAQLGQVVEEARQAAEAEAARAAKEITQAKAEAARAVAEAEAQVAEARAEAAELAEPTNLGAAAGATVQIIPRTTVTQDLLTVSYEEVVGDFEQVNTAAAASWEWLKAHGWQGDPTDGEERLYSPQHANYVNTRQVHELESVWCYPILPGSDVTDHVADVLKAAGWYEADLYEPGGTPWLLPPEAAN